MSQGAIIAFRNNEPDTIQYFRNSWLGAAWIWNYVFDEFVKDPNKPYDNWMYPESRGNDLWHTAYNPEIPEYIRAVMAGTFDYAIVKQENFDRYIGHLKDFWKRYYIKDDSKQSSHLMAWVAFIEQSKDAQAIGFHATTVTENLWMSYTYNETTGDEEQVLYNLSTGTKHIEVYDLIKDEVE